MRRFALAVLVVVVAVGFAVGGLASPPETAQAAAPTVTGVSPNSGGSGISVTITGSGFGICGGFQAPTVSFGGTSAPVTTCATGTLVVTSPACPASTTVDVIVTNGDGSGSSIASAADKFNCTGGNGGGGGTATFSGTVYFVAPNGSDNSACLFGAGSNVNDPSTFACATVQAAVDKTRDRDIVVVYPGSYDIAAPIEVPDLIVIVPLAVGSTSPTTTFSGGATSSLSGSSSTSCPQGTPTKVVLRSANGQPIFHVTGAGSPSLFPVISGFILGGSTSFYNPGAIQLDGTSYAQVQCNIIGQEDLPNVIGILLKNADNVFIHDNTIHGSSQFPISPVLGPTPPVGGFGIVTSECLGGGHSDDALILNNLLALNSNAGILLCSDGAGGHIIVGNTVRGNGRGIVLKDANDVIAAANAVQDNYYDGFELLEASTGNIITTNSIESHDGPNSSGVLLQGNGTLFPLNNVFTSNFFRRNRTNIAIIGARRTLIGVDKTVKNTLEGKFGPAGHVFLVDPGNVMSASGERTDIVLSLGNPSGMALSSASPSFGQPSDTVISGNTIQSNGPCNATRGCAIRLTAGVSVNIDATRNEWGVTQPEEIRASIWDKFRDSTLGQVVIANQTLGILGTPPASPTLSPGYPPPPAYTPAALTGSPVAAPNFPARGNGTGNGPPPAPPTAYVDPATGDYYVELTLCVLDANNRPVANDQLTIAVSDANGNAAGSASVGTGANGCFVGDVAASGASAAAQPASVAITDASGAITNLTVGAGSPLYRPPLGPPASASR